MSTFELKINNMNRIDLNIGSALSGKKIDVNIINRKNDAPRAISQYSQNLARSIKQTVECLKKAQNGYYIKINSGKDEVYDKYLKPLEESFINTIFRASELFECFTDVATLEKSDKPSDLRKEYNNIIKKRRNDWGMLCNRIKHNQNSLISKCFIYHENSSMVLGYSLMKPVKLNELWVNTEFHKGKERERSYLISLMQLIFDVLKCDIAAAKFISSLPDSDSPPLGQYNLSWDVVEPLRILSTLPLLTTPTESSVFDKIELTDNKIFTTRGKATKFKSGCMTRTYFVSDGITQTYEFK